ncbi:MAG: hypothetical protein LC660_08190, partial [Desulfobacteraceae bacterium]|nr:hypothetical protein [Desulfobacteraceae bacterium]
MNSEKTADIIWSHVSWVVITTIVLVLTFHGTPALAETGHSFEKPYFAADYLLTRVNPSFAKDLDPLHNSRFIKVLIASSKTSFFIDKGRFNGFEYEFLSAYETFVNQVVDRYFRIKILFIPVALEDIFSFLEKGYGDIAATGLSFPEYPNRQFSFSRPYIHDVRNHPVYAYQESNSGTFLVNSGMMQYALVDEHIVDAWNPVLHRIRGEKQPLVHSSGNITLAVRRG